MTQVSQFAVIPSGPKRDRRLALAGWGFLAMVVAVSLLGTVGKPPEHYQGADFGTYYRAANRVRGAEPLYVDDGHGPMQAFIYAPAYAFGFIPLTSLNYLWAYRLWMLVNWGLTAAAFLLALVLVRSGRQSTADYRLPTADWPIIWLAALPLFSYFWSGIHMGQVTSLLVACCLGWAVCRRRGWPFPGGVLLAMGCFLKLAPCLLLPYLLIRRDWRGLAGVFVGSFALFALPVFWVGWQGTSRLHEEWLKRCRETQVPVQTYRLGNQSLLGQLARLPGISNGETCHSLARLRLLEQVYPFALVVLGGLVYGWIARNRHRGPGQLDPARENRRDNLHLAVLLIFMTLAHPRAWRCNFFALVLPCLMLADGVCRRGFGWKVALAALGAVLFACALPTIGLNRSEWSWPGWFLQGKHFWGALAVASACGVTCSIRIREPFAPAASPRG